MNCCQCQGLETVFNKKRTTQELEQYRKQGPRKTTRMLIDALKAGGVGGMAWWTKIGWAIGNFVFRVLRNPFRAWVHPTEAVDALVWSRVSIARTSYGRWWSMSTSESAC